MQQAAKAAFVSGDTTSGNTRGGLEEYDRALERPILARDAYHGEGELLWWIIGIDIVNNYEEKPQLSDVLAREGTVRPDTRGSSGRRPTDKVMGGMCLCH